MARAGCHYRHSMLVATVIPGLPLPSYRVRRYRHPELDSGSPSYKGC